MKEVDKSKLFGEVQLHNAREECAIQQMFDSDRIVKVIEYTETQNEIISIMEFIQDAQWLEKKIDQRKREIKNELKIKQIAHDVLEGI
jgi:hypothetical protein